MSDGPNRVDNHFGSLLRHYRGLRGMTQGELAERAGLNLQAISMLERGLRQAPRSTTIEFLAQALKLDAEQRDAFLAAASGRPDRRLPTGGLHAPEPGPTPGASARLAATQALLASMPTDVLPPRGALPAGSRMPLAPNPLFVGRGDELLQVAKALRGGDTALALGQVVACTGLGGLGKTQLVVELVHRYGRFFAGGVFWLSFASAEEIPLQVAACAEAGLETRPLEERVRRVKDAWQTPVPRLLVFDNCEEEALLDTWRPPSGGCRVLVTSRRSQWSPTLGVVALPLDLLPRPDSIELLGCYLPDLTANGPCLDAVAAEVGDLPLALHLAGSYLRAYRAEVCLDSYLAELRRSDVVQHASLLGSGLDDSPSPTHHVQSVAQTFSLCFGRLDREREVDQVAIALLARMASMAPGEPVPHDLLAKTMEDVDPRLRADGLKQLRAAGLVQEGEGWLRLHRLLVHFVRQERPDSNAQPAVARALIGCGEDAYQGHLTGSALAAVIPHLVEVAGTASGVAGDERLTANLCTATGRVLRYAGDLRAARPWYERALAIRERVTGSDHLDTAGSLNNLGGLLWAQGELAAARALSERALAIRERALGPDHPDTAESLNGLGVLLWDQGEFAAARPLLERALAVRERVLGRDHRDTASNLNSLGTVLRAQGELAAARSLYERALDIRERILGPDHPHTANMLDNLGQLLREQGELALAKPLLERALAARERVLGPDHPGTAASLNNLAALLRKQGELAAARPLIERALAIWEKVLGPDHPHTAAGLNNLALLLWDQGELADAKPLFERALDIRERVLGPDHPDTARSLNGLARLLRDHGKLDAAKPLFERALEINKRVLGSGHPDTATSLRDLAFLRQDQGQLDAAEPLFERALDIRERVLGPDHPVTARTLIDRALLLQAQGQLDSASALFGRAIDIEERALGPGHPRVAQSLNNRALLHHAQGDPAAARPLFERALAIRERVLGPDHPDTVATRRALAGLAGEGDGPDVAGA